MDFKGVVEHLLDGRPITWIAKKLEKTRQNMESFLSNNNPKMDSIKEVAKVFEMDEIKFLQIWSDLDKKEKSCIEGM